MNIRIGHGIDIHQFEENIPFILGGIPISCAFGIKGHSDGDVLIHSIMDAILGAINKGDIGDHFPSSDNSYLLQPTKNKDINAIISSFFIL